MKGSSMYFQIFKDASAANQWRWRLKAANHQIIATSGESYWNKADCLHAVGLVKQSGNAQVYEA
jgi:uncharacterized protein YegP (UPF0339 family)